MYIGLVEVMFVEMADVEMTISQKLKSITVPVLFNILLPIFDVFSDARIIILLFIGGFKCRNIAYYDDAVYDEYRSCRRNPTSYCTSPTPFPGVCDETDDGFRCRYGQDEYRSCLSDSASYCTSNNAFPGVCGRLNHPLFGIMLMIPFLLNYIMAFITWWRLDNNKKVSFIFALLNLYAPYGKFTLN